MNFLKTIGKAVGGAVGFVGEKNRRAAYLNRIRTVIKCEEKAADKEYLALGRYYYNNLRDRENPVTEAHCAELEQIEQRLDKALNQLEQFYQQEQNSGLTVTIDIVKDEAAQSPDSSVGVIGGADGPTAVYTAKGGSEIEEVTLEGVEEFDHDPMAEPAPKEEPAAQAQPQASPAPGAGVPAEPDENDSLPFEG